MNFNNFILMLMLVLLFQIEPILSASSGSEKGFNNGDFNWFKDEHHSLVSPEEMRLPSTIHHTSIPNHDHVTSEHSYKHQQHQRQQADNDYKGHHIHGSLQQALEHARKTGVGSLLNKKRPREYSTTTRAKQLREERQRLLEDPKTAKIYINARKAKEQARRDAWTPEQKAKRNESARKSAKAQREWSSSGTDDEFNLHDFNFDDMSWLSEFDHLPTSSPPRQHQQIHHPTSTSSQNAAQAEQHENQTKRQNKNTRNPEYYSSLLEKGEGQLKLAKEKLEEARKTGKGSLQKPKEYSTTKIAEKARERRKQRAQRGGKEYEDYLKHRRAFQKARRQARTPEEKSIERAKQKAREKRRSEWLKLPGNEAEQEAKKLKHRASSNRFWAKQGKQD